MWIPFHWPSRSTFRLPNPRRPQALGSRTRYAVGPVLAYYGLIRQTRTHGPTSCLCTYTARPARQRTLRAGPDPFLALHHAPCNCATTHTPENSPGASARVLPGDAAFAHRERAQRSQHPATTSTREPLTTLQCSLHAAAQLLASPPGWPWLAPARTLPPELSPRRSPSLRVRFASRLTGIYRGWTYTNWSKAFASCTLGGWLALSETGI